MLKIRAAACALVALLLAAATVDPAVASHLNVSLDCPSSVEPGARPRLDVRVENTRCEAQSVRILSTVVGNGDQTAGGVGILGPVVAAASVSVPAATDLMPAACIQFRCGERSGGRRCGPYLSGPGGPQGERDGQHELVSDRTQRSDRVHDGRGAFTPGTLELTVDTTIVPPSLSGTVATHILISEFDSGAKVETEINECCVEVL